VRPETINSFPWTGVIVCLAIGTLMCLMWIRAWRGKPVIPGTTTNATEQLQRMVPGLLPGSGIFLFAVVAILGKQGLTHQSEIIRVISWAVFLVGAVMGLASLVVFVALLLLPSLTDTSLRWLNPSRWRKDDES
jgi:hypothetical protein